MIQIGNLHIGKADTATPPTIDIGAAFILSQQIYYRYGCIEQTQKYHNWAHDPEFKMMIKTGLNYLKKEVSLIEKQMDKYKVPQSSRSPMSVKTNDTNSCSTLTNDQFIFEQVRRGCIEAVDKNLNNSMMIISDDSLRTMFIDFVKEELDILIQCCKYGKLKGWLPTYPTYKAD